MHSNSLWRPTWDLFSGSSWLSRAPWTPRYLRPQQLSSSIFVSPAEGFELLRRQPSGSELSAAATQQGKSERLATDLFFFFHFTKTLRCCLGFVFLGLLLGLFWIQLKSLCNAVLLSYFPFFKISYPLLWRDAFLVNSHVFQDHEMTPVWKKTPS